MTNMRLDATSLNGTGENAPASGHEVPIAKYNGATLFLKPRVDDLNDKNYYPFDLAQFVVATTVNGRHVLGSIIDPNFFLENANPAEVATFEVNGQSVRTEVKKTIVGTASLAHGNFTSFAELEKLNIPITGEFLLACEFIRIATWSAISQEDDLHPGNIGIVSVVLTPEQVDKLNSDDKCFLNVDVNGIIYQVSKRNIYPTGGAKAYLAVRIDEDMSYYLETSLMKGNLRALREGFVWTLDVIKNLLTTLVPTHGPITNIYNYYKGPVEAIGTLATLGTYTEGSPSNIGGHPNKSYSQQLVAAMNDLISKHFAEFQNQTFESLLEFLLVYQPDKLKEGLVAHFGAANFKLNENTANNIKALIATQKTQGGLSAATKQTLVKLGLIDETVNELKEGTEAYQQMIERLNTLTAEGVPAVDFFLRYFQCGYDNIYELVVLLYSGCDKLGNRFNISLPSLKQYIKNNPGIIERILARVEARNKSESSGLQQIPQLDITYLRQRAEQIKRDAEYADVERVLRVFETALASFGVNPSQTDTTCPKSSARSTHDKFIGLKKQYPSQLSSVDQHNPLNVSYKAILDGYNAIFAAYERYTKISLGNFELGNEAKSLFSVMSDWSRFLSEADYQRKQLGLQTIEARLRELHQQNALGTLNPEINSKITAALNELRRYLGMTEMNATTKQTPAKKWNDTELLQELLLEIKPEIDSLDPTTFWEIVDRGRDAYLKKVSMLASNGRHIDVERYKSSNNAALSDIFFSIIFTGGVEATSLNTQLVRGVLIETKEWLRINTKYASVYNKIYTSLSDEESATIASIWQGQIRSTLGGLLATGMMKLCSEFDREGAEGKEKLDNIIVKAKSTHVQTRSVAGNVLSNVTGFFGAGSRVRDEIVDNPNLSATKRIPKIVKESSNSSGFLKYFLIGLYEEGHRRCLAQNIKQASSATPDDFGARALLAAESMPEYRVEQVDLVDFSMFRASQPCEAFFATLVANTSFRKVFTQPQQNVPKQIAYHP